MYEYNSASGHRRREGVRFFSIASHFECTALRPAPGLRDYGNGLLRVVGSYGFNWSSSFTGTYTYRLSFYSGAVLPNDTSYRAYGLQLRCLQE